MENKKGLCSADRNMLKLMLEKIAMINYFKTKTCLD